MNIAFLTVCCNSTLCSNDWKLDLASDNYFANPEMYYKELDIKKVEQLFNKYRDPSSERILSGGIIKFLEDLNLSPESRLVLILAFKFRESKLLSFFCLLLFVVCNLFIDSVKEMMCKRAEKKINNLLSALSLPPENRSSNTV